MWIYGILASLTYAFINFIGIEIILSAIFTIDDNNKNIKLTFGKVLEDTKYKKTSLFVYLTLIIVPVYFFVSGSLQTTIINYLATTGWKTIPSFTAVVSFSALWLTKVILRRRWDFKLVWVPLMSFIISFLIIIFL